jgi:hypothetical protein
VLSAASFRNSSSKRASIWLSSNCSANSRPARPISARDMEEAGLNIDRKLDLMNYGSYWQKAALNAGGFPSLHGTPHPFGGLS